MAALELRQRRQRGSPLRLADRGTRPCRIGAAAGYSMIEVLVSLVVLLLGLLGLIGLQAKAHNAEIESYQRAQAIVLLQDMFDRMNANRSDAYKLAYSDAAVGGGGALGDCSGKTGAAFDLCEWDNLLKGATEVSASGRCSSASGSNCVGAMVGARGNHAAHSAQLERDRPMRGRGPERPPERDRRHRRQSCQWVQLT